MSAKPAFLLRETGSGFELLVFDRYVSIRLRFSNFYMFYVRHKRIDVKSINDVQHNVPKEVMD